MNCVLWDWELEAVAFVEFFQPLSSSHYCGENSSWGGSVNESLSRIASFIYDSL
jgi:hypothetical protein